MVKTASTMLPLGTQAPDFSLPDATARGLAGRFRRRPALLVLFMCNHCPYVKHVADGLAAVGARSTSRAAWPWSGSTRTTWRNYPDDSPGKDGRGSEAPRLHLPLSLRRNASGGQGVSGGLHAGLLRVRQGPASWSIAARSITAGRATACRSPAKTCARRSTPCWPASPFRRTRSPASAATSNGSRATSRRTSDEQFDRHSANSGATRCGITPAWWPAGEQFGDGLAAAGPKSSVQSLTYIPTNWSAFARIQAAAETQGVVERLVAMLQAVRDALACSSRWTSRIASGPRSLRIALAPSGSGRPVWSNHHWPVSTTSSSRWSA